MNNAALQHALIFFGTIAFLLWLLGWKLNRPNMQWWGIGIGIYQVFVLLGWAFVLALDRFSPRAANADAVRSGVFLLQIVATVWLVKWFRGRPTLRTSWVFIFAAIALVGFVLSHS
jgi:hypothetical protein